VQEAPGGGEVPPGGSEKIVVHETASAWR